MPIGLASASRNEAAASSNGGADTGGPGGMRVRSTGNRAGILPVPQLTMNSCVCAIGISPLFKSLQAWPAAAPWSGILKRRRGAEHAEIIERSPDDLETGRYSQTGHSARNARDRALAHHVKWVGENPLHVSRHFLSIDGEVGVVVVMFGLDRRDRRRRADQDIVLIQDRAERFVHIAGSEVTSIEPRRAVAESAFEQMNDERFHLVAPAGQQVARDSGEQAFPVSQPCVERAIVPADVDFLDLASETFEHLGCLERVATHLWIDLEVTEVHRERPLPPLDAFDVLRP